MIKKHFYFHFTLVNTSFLFILPFLGDFFYISSGIIFKWRSIIMFYTGLD